MSKINRSVGIILRKNNLKENDVIISLLSKDLGRTDYVVKSVKKQASKNQSKIDIGNLVSYCFVETKRLSVITELKLIQNFQYLKEDSTFNPYFLLVLELIEKSSFDYREFNIYSEVVEILDAFSKKNIFQIQILISFLIISILNELGLSIETENYQDTKSPIVQTNEYFASYDLGFLEHSADNVLSLNEFKILKYMTAASLKDIMKLNLEKINSNAILNVVLNWSEVALNKRLVSRSLLN